MLITEFDNAVNEIWDSTRRCDLQICNSKVMNYIQNWARFEVQLQQSDSKKLRVQFLSSMLDSNRLNKLIEVWRLPSKTVCLMLWFTEKRRVELLDKVFADQDEDINGFKV